MIDKYCRVFPMENGSHGLSYRDLLVAMLAQGCLTRTSIDHSDFTCYATHVVKFADAIVVALKKELPNEDVPSVID